MVNDPVNYIDPFGLTPTDTKTGNDSSTEKGTSVPNENLIESVTIQPQNPEPTVEIRAGGPLVIIFEEHTEVYGPKMPLAIKNMELQYLLVILLIILHFI